LALKEVKKNCAKANISRLKAKSIRAISFFRCHPIFINSSTSANHFLFILARMNIIITPLATVALRGYILGEKCENTKVSLFFIFRRWKTFVAPCTGAMKESESSQYNFTEIQMEHVSYKCL
jgi:hypothetical protein